MFDLIKLFSKESLNILEELANKKWANISSIVLNIVGCFFAGIFAFVGVGLLIKGVSIRWEVAVILLAGGFMGAGMIDLSARLRKKSLGRYVIKLFSAISKNSQEDIKKLSEEISEIKLITLPMIFLKAISHQALGDMNFGEIGSELKARDNYKSALDCYDSAIKLNSTVKDFYYGKVWCLYQLRRYADAINCFLEVKEETSPAYHFCNQLIKEAKKQKEIEDVPYDRKD